MHAWVRDHIIIIQKLVLCSFRNEIITKYDADWYLAVIQPSLEGIIEEEPQFEIFNPLGYVVFAIMTFTWWIWV